jgi:hypothetical protein
MSLKCKNEKCNYRLNNGTCELFERCEYDMNAEHFVDENICGWINKLE